MKRPRALDLWGAWAWAPASSPLDCSELCDRCGAVTGQVASEVVTCATGDVHYQCTECARRTRAEARPASPRSGR